MSAGPCTTCVDVYVCVYVCLYWVVNVSHVCAACKMRSKENKSERDGERERDK